MKGLEIAKEFYNQYGKAMLEENFSDVKDRIAVGLVGAGSECFGYDDDISKDHDFDAGFCLFITQEDERLFGFKLERAYAKLPKEFMGLKRQTLSPADGNRHGVIVLDEFYKRFLGQGYAPDTVTKWLKIPSEYLACACNGEVFCDKLGEFSKVRETLLKGYPEDIRLKKISAHAAVMGQAGQYNFARCIARGETGAAQLAVFEFVKHAISVIYLLNNKYELFYKWAYRGMRDLPILSDLEFALSGISELGNSKTQAGEKMEIINDVAAMIISEFHNQGITDATCNNLDTHAYSIADKIKNSEVRNLNVFEGI